MKTKTLDSHGLAGISFNADYTKYSHERDARITELCKSKKLECLTLDDICLHPPGEILTSTGKVYTKFTPFWRASVSKDIRKPVDNKMNNYLHSSSSIAKKLKNISDLGYITLEDVMKPEGHILGKHNPHLPEKGGREQGLTILKRIADWKDYDDQHDQLVYNTTHLSAFNKFGCVSIREVFHAMSNKLGKESGVVRQLFWRDFFYHLSHANPEIYQHSLNPKYRNIRWEKNLAGWRAWCTGQTGFPVVDACMRELNTTGYMHNRARLITASFLVKTLLISWQEGEKYFATRLTDYDPASNNGNWQWISSTGVDSQPYFRIFNPWLQAENFDPNCEYIKKWIPELKDVPVKDILNWEEKYSQYKNIKYPKPMCNYQEQKEKALKMYKDAL
jgi:deoxyribodipyrimidine photo-lyase